LGTQRFVYPEYPCARETADGLNLLYFLEDIADTEWEETIPLQQVK